MVKLAVPQVRGWLGVVFFGPSWLEQWLLAVLRISSPSPSCLRWSGRAPPVLAAWRGDLWWEKGTLRRNASGVLGTNTSGLGRDATRLFLVCTLTRVTVLEKFPRVFLEG